MVAFLLAALLTFPTVTLTPRLCVRDGLGIPVQVGNQIMDATGSEWVFQSFTIVQPGTKPTVTARPLLGGVAVPMPLSAFPRYEVHVS